MTTILIISNSRSSSSTPSRTIRRRSKSSPATATSQGEPSSSPVYTQWQTSTISGAYCSPPQTIWEKLCKQRPQRKFSGLPSEGTTAPVPRPVLLLVRSSHLQRFASFATSSGRTALPLFWVVSRSLRRTLLCTIMKKACSTYAASIVNVGGKTCSTMMGDTCRILLT
jgi:hypothetical protein